jgi:hypothetical protein
MAAVPINSGGPSAPKVVERYAWIPSAAAAIGAVKPASRETQPARNPAAGCTVNERKVYSPPLRGMRRARAP